MSLLSLLPAAYLLKRRVTFNYSRIFRQLLLFHILQLILFVFLFVNTLWHQHQSKASRLSRCACVRACTRMVFFFSRARKRQYYDHICLLLTLNNGGKKSLSKNHKCGSHSDIGVLGSLSTSIAFFYK